MLVAVDDANVETALGLGVLDQLAQEALAQPVAFLREPPGLLAGVGSAGACDGSFIQDLNARWCPTCPKPSHNPGAGAVMQAQLWFRDPMNTSNQTTSLSDAVEFTVQP